MLFPKPTRNLVQLLGPSVLLVAMAINGGELLLWPSIIAGNGFKVIWTVPVILLLQYFVNLEIERYVTVTGESTLTGLLRLGRWLSPLFIASIVVSLVWPAWAAPAGEMLAYLLGLEGFGPLFGIGVLAGLALIWQSPSSYKILEWIAKVGLVTVLLIVVFTLVSQWDPGLPRAVGAGLLNFGNFPANVDRFGLLSALAFGGVVGVLNLAQSDWVQSKGYGAAGVENPEQIDWNRPESTANFRAWWRLLQQEHAIVYYFGNVVGIMLLAALAYVTLRGSSASGFAILTEQVELLGTRVGTLFALAVVLIFVMAQMTILDATGTLLKRCFETTSTRLRDVPKARISQTMALLGMLILALSYLIPSFAQPVFLLKLSASLSAGVMVLYPPLLLKLNRSLPTPHTAESFGTVHGRGLCGVLRGGDCLEPSLKKYPHRDIAMRIKLFVAN